MDWLGQILAIVAAVGFGFSNIFIRIGMRTDKKDNGVGTTIIVNFVLYGLLLSIMTALGKVPPLNSRGLAGFVVAGLLTTLLGRILQYGSTRLIGASRATTLKVASPVFTVAISVALLSESLSWGMLWGTALVLLGVWMLGQETQQRRDEVAVTAESGRPTRGSTVLPEQRNSSMLKRGLLLGVLAAASFGTGRVMRKVGMLYIPSPFLGAFIGSTVALLTFTAVNAYQSGHSPLDPKMWRRIVPSLSAPFILAGVATTVAQLSNFGAIFYTKVSTASILVSTEPLMTILLSWFFLRTEEKVTLRIVGIAALVFAGVAMIVLYS